MKRQSKSDQDESPFLYDPQDVRDSCGVGFIAKRTGLPSRTVVKKAFEALGNLVHRGAIDADGKTGDGAGILTTIPKKFYIKKARAESVDLASCKDFGVMMIFFPTAASEENICRSVIRSVFEKYNITVLWSREVPVDVSVLGEKGLSVKPIIWQKFIECPRYLIADEFEEFLYILRKEVETLVMEYSCHDFFVPSMSERTMVHKGLFLGSELENFYTDLKDKDFVSEFVLFHQRFSTNTTPSWALAQPFRMLGHNGEINTIRGNRNWMRARELADRSHNPFIMPRLSDSGSFDNVLEMYVHGGRSISHAIVHMMPEVWQNQKNIDDNLRAFYEYHACLAEQWGGPAAIAFSDGKYVGVITDRNGLRPARYKITKDFILVCSEMGCVNFDEKDVIENGKLSPGKIIIFHVPTKKILKNDEIKQSLSNQAPYGDWLQKNLVCIEEELIKKKKNIYKEESGLNAEQALLFKKVFGYTQEDMDMILTPMFQNGSEPVGSMGDDTPLSVFSKKPKLLYTYFKQLFAQVTNPAIDPIRERFGTSLRMFLGKSGNIFEQTEKHARLIRLKGPVVTASLFKALTHHADFPCATLSTHFNVSEGAESLEDTVVDLCLAAETAVDRGCSLIVLSDRAVTREQAPIPMLLAVSAVHQHLMRKGKRLKASLIVETGEARETHHFACLIGYGASAIYPYLAVHEAMMFGGEGSVKNYIQALEVGLLKIMSKMGISVLQAYHAAQIFEALGLKNYVVRQYFEGTPGKISGANLTDIAKDYLSWHQKAFFKEDTVIDIGGFYRFRREGEYHAFNPDMVKLLHKAVIENNLDAYHQYTKLVNEREPMTIRDLLVFKKGSSIAVDLVESSEKIVTRFCTPGISHGAVSKETHEDFAIAMNRLHAKSDSGEGGEDPARFGTEKNSAIKQVASGRFGVTAHYISQAQELEIKIAQGAKPGEGGQLPGHKVSAEIAKIRHATPGVMLISPPPHHDIYSIEDLSQLIYDLKQANPKARVCVKLVAEDGVGTIAAGVAKAHADVILISGHDGGTGASSLSSIKNAGLPWELGLAEAQQVLVRNRLRDRVVLRVDGGLKTGMDVVKAAILGAEEFGFGTASVVAVGCVMVRQCHLNTCPVGVATQDPELRKKYKGTPERVINMFHFVAEEIRLILASLGFKSLEEIIGRVDLLTSLSGIKNSKIQKVKLSKILAHPDSSGKSPLTHKIPRNDWVNDVPFDKKMISDCDKILKSGKGEIHLKYSIRNIHRSVGAQLSYEIVSRFGANGLPNGTIHVELTGTAGQSFGVFGMKTLTMKLVGEANDYVGKGLSGAVLILKTSSDSVFKPEDNIICGNTCLYGATSGRVFINGRVGERFAVRNSGASAVVEGMGDHGCEYMTGGHVLILGPVGDNFGAGMTGGVACIYDKSKSLQNHHNPEDIELCDVNWDDERGGAFLSLLEEHVQNTESPLATRILKNWQSESKNFVLIMPKEILSSRAKPRDISAPLRVGRDDK